MLLIRRINLVMLEMNLEVFTCESVCMPNEK